MAKETKTELAVIDFTKFSVAQLPELKGKKEEIASIIKANPIVEIIDNSTYESAKKSRTAVRSLRTSLENEQKTVKKKIKEHVLDVVDKEYDILVLGVKSEEKDRQDPITIWEDKKEQERLEKVRLEQERIDSIKSLIVGFRQNWEDLISQLFFSEIDNLKSQFYAVVNQFNRNALDEYEVLFDDAVSHLTNLLNSRISTLTEQEQIRIDNLLIEEKNAENSRIQEWQRTWSANIDTLTFDDVKDVKSVLVKSKLANLKHYYTDYEQIYTSTEKRLHSQIEFVSKAEEQRIAQEKFQKEKADFERKQAEAKFQERCRQLTDLGFVLNESNEAYQKGLNYLNLEDIKLANDDLWLRELEDAKNVKDFSEIETIDASEQEVVFEDVSQETSEKNIENKNVFDVSKIESQIWNNIYEEWNLVSDKYPDAFEYLKEFYHSPKKKQ